jgi:hypothetical protein
MVKRRSEEPFEDAVIFTAAAARSPEESHELWWKYSKYLTYGDVEDLFIPPGVLLLLK